MTALEKAQLVHELIDEMRALRFKNQDEWVSWGLMTTLEFANYVIGQDILSRANQAANEARQAAVLDQEFDYPPEYAELLSRRDDLTRHIRVSAKVGYTLQGLFDPPYGSSDVREFLAVDDMAKTMLDSLHAEVDRKALFSELGKVERSIKAKSRKGTLVHHLNVERATQGEAAVKEAGNAARADALTGCEQALALKKAAEDARAARIEERWSAIKEEVVAILGEEVNES